MFPLPSVVPVKLVAVTAVLAATFVTGFVAGLRLEGKRHADYIAKQATAAVAIITRQGATTTRVVTRYVAVANETKAAERAIQQEVQTYANAGACLNDAWGRLHDAAAANALPAPARSAVSALRAP